MNKSVYILMVFILFIAAACSKRSGITTVKEKREINLYSSIPANAVSVKLNTEDSFVFCIDRNEMMRVGDSIIKHVPTNYDCRNLLISEYFEIIDSVQKTHGVVDINELWFCEDILTGRIVFELLPKGHLWIKYKNGTYVHSVSYTKKQTEAYIEERYKDKRNGKTLYSGGYSIRAFH